MTRRRQSLDTPGFDGYLGGGRYQRPAEDPPPLHGNPMRAMFELMPAGEGCWGEDCWICRQPRRPRRPQGGSR